MPTKKEKPPLSVTHPELAKEADGWDPSQVTAGTGKKFKWKCFLGHIWETTPAHRLRGQGCPYCGNRKVLIGFNDLKTTHPSRFTTSVVRLIETHCANLKSPNWPYIIEVVLLATVLNPISEILFPRAGLRAIRGGPVVAPVRVIHEPFTR